MNTQIDYYYYNYLERLKKMMKVYNCFPEGKAKALTMSYDDGKLQDERLVSIFNKYGIKGTFNLNYGLMDNQIGRAHV